MIAHTLRAVLLLLVSLSFVGGQQDGVLFAQNEPVVLVGAERESCSGNSCQWQAGTGNGVIIEATSQRLVVATAGHNVYQGRNVSVYVSRQWTPATRHHAEYSSIADFGIVIIEGDYSMVPSARIFADPLPYGVPVSVDGYWPGQPKWMYRRLSLRRMLHRMLGDSLDQPVTQGVSGAPVMYQGQVAGIVVGIDQPTIARSSVTYYTQSSQMLSLMQTWGVTVNPGEAEATPNAKMLAKEMLPAESPVEAPERQASSDAPASRSGGASEQLLPAEELPHDVAESPRGTDAPLPQPSGAKEWAWDGLSAWAWAAIGAGVAGPLGWAIPVAGRVMHRRLKSKRGGDPVSTAAAPVPMRPDLPNGSPGASHTLHGDHQIPPPRNTDVGRERIIEKVVDMSEEQRREYERRIAELQQQRTVEYREINTDSGLLRMRKAMTLTADTYPAAHRWIKTIEGVYTTLLSGDKQNA